MGLIRAAVASAKGVMADQWKEFFYCDALPADVLVVRGHKRTSRHGSNTKGSDNIITNGSVIAVAEGQCMMIVDQGRIVEFCAEPGEFVFDTSEEPTIFTGDLSGAIEDSFRQMCRRFSFGGETAHDQRVYYFNTKEMSGNKYGTPNPVPFRVVDQRAGIDIDISVRCFGEYSYRISDPILFYANVCGNVTEAFTRTRIESQMKTEFLTALQPAFAKISEMGIRYSSLPGHTMEMADALNEVLSAKWRELRGIEIVSVGVSSVKASEEDEQMIRELQKSAAFMDPTRAAAHLVNAQAEAMQAAAKNTGGSAMAFMGMNMAGQMGGAAPQNLYQMGQQMNMANAAANMNQNTYANAAETSANAAVNMGAGTNASNTAANTWTCPSCKTINQGNFCMHCGQKKPEAVRYRCDKCGWEPADPAHLPNFCPQCGDRFDENDRF